MATVSNTDNVDAVAELAGEFDALTRDLLDELTTAESHTTLLREATGMSRQTVHRRLDKLEERGLVETETRAPDAGGQPRRHATLTEYGEEMIDEGLLEAIHDTNKNLKALEQRLTRVHSELEGELENLPSREEVSQIARRAARSEQADLDDRLDNLDIRIDRLESRIGELSEEYSQQYDRLAEDVSALQPKTTRTKRDVDRLQDRTEDLGDRVEALEGRHGDRVAALVEHVSRLYAAVDELQEEAREARTTAATAKRRAEADDEGMQEKVNENDETIDRLRELVNNKIREFDRRLSALEDDVASAKDTGSNIEERLNDLREDLDELREEIPGGSGGLF